MLIKMRFDGLIFVGLSLEQIENVEYHANKCTILKDESGGMQVRGRMEDLYQLLYKLSVTYDLEIM